MLCVSEDHREAGVRLHARKGKRRTYLLLPVGAGLGLLFKVLWDWYNGSP
jgi:hypothetical protein